MLLVIDIGNTHTVLGMFDGATLVGSWRLRSDKEKTVDEYALEIVSLLQMDGVGSERITKVIMSCVVPPLTRVFTKLARKYFNQDALVVGPGIKTGMEINYDDPRSVGADRIVNAVAAREQFGAPVVVVDFGTATTFDIVNSAGQYDGGIIAPGLLLSLEALSTRAAKLPTIELTMPTELIGHTTKDAMLSGVMFGYISLVEGLIARLKEKLGESVTVVATGGLAQSIAEGTDCIQEVIPDLTLRGLQLIAEKNE